MTCLHCPDCPEGHQRGDIVGMVGCCSTFGGEVLTPIRSTGRAQSCRFCKPERHEVFPPWFTPSKHARTQAKMVLRGRHPFGFELHEDASIRCRGCANRSVHQHAGRYWKCSLVKATCGPGTDLRLKWRSCEHFLAE